MFSSFPAGGLNAVRLIILPKGIKVCGHRAAGAVPEDKGVERWGKVQRKETRNNRVIEPRTPLNDVSNAGLLMSSSYKTVPKMRLGEWRVTTCQQ